MKIKNKIDLFNCLATELTDNMNTRLSMASKQGEDNLLNTWGLCSAQGITSNLTNTGLKRQILSLRVLLSEIDQELNTMD